MTKLLLAAFALIAAAAPARAVGVLEIAANGNDATVVDTSPGSLSIDFGINNTRPIVVDLVANYAEDLDGVTFDSVIDSFLTVNRPGNALRTLTLTLGGGASFRSIGSVAPAFSTATGVIDATGSVYTITFARSEPFGLILGDVGDGGSDFVISTGAVETGSTFSLTLGATAVPEPASWALLIAGFGLVGTQLRRRRPAIAV